LLTCTTLEGGQAIVGNVTQAATRERAGQVSAAQWTLTDANGDILEPGFALTSY
jgi:hypothetical protein